MPHHFFNWDDFEVPPIWRQMDNCFQHASTARRAGKESFAAAQLHAYLKMHPEAIVQRRNPEGIMVVEKPVTGEVLEWRYTDARP